MAHCKGDDMKQVLMYITTDNKSFEQHNTALRHQTDLLGESLDDLLPHDDRGNITYTDRYNILSKLMKTNSRKETIKKVKQVLKCLEALDNDEN